MIFFGNDHTIREFSQGESSPDSGARVSRGSRPRHCGNDMRLTMNTANPAEDSLPPTYDNPVPDHHLVWQCQCGFHLHPQPDKREQVWAAAAAVEACQWEMDHAVQQLHRALRAASANGVTDELLAESAQLPLSELQGILGQTRSSHPGIGAS